MSGTAPIYSGRLAQPVAKVLPPDAARWLVEAAAVHITPQDPHARVRAIERACDRIRSSFPNALQKDI